MIVIVSSNQTEIQAVLTALGVKPEDAVTTVASAIKTKAKKAPAQGKAHWVTREALLQVIKEHAPVTGQELTKLCPDQAGHIHALLATMRLDPTCGVYQDQKYWNVRA